MKRFIHSALCLAACVCAVAGGAGCEARTKDDWYAYSSDVERRKKEYVSVQMQNGMSEEEASRAWGLQYSIELTHKRDPAVRERDGEGLGQVIEFQPQP